MDHSTNIATKNDTLVTQARYDHEKQDCYAVRKKVFIDEQQWPFEMVMDDWDVSDNSFHFIAYHRSKPVGSARLRKLTDHSDVGKVERVAVLKEARGLGIGHSLLRELESFAKKNGFAKLVLNAQIHAQPFYERLGFSAKGNTFITSGIQHIGMEKELD